MEINGKEVKAQIWDMAGQERFRAVTSAYYRGAVGALFVYDITRRTTFDSVTRWLGELKIYKEEVEEEMEIGFPTDVKHLTHIGWDGSTTTNPVKGWENLRGPELVASPSISLKQFELAMAAQAADQHHLQTTTISADLDKYKPVYQEEQD